MIQYLIEILDLLHNHGGNNCMIQYLKEIWDKKYGTVPNHFKKHFI